MGAVQFAYRHKLLVLNNRQNMHTLSILPIPPITIHNEHKPLLLIPPPKHRPLHLLPTLQYRIHPHIVPPLLLPIPIHLLLVVLGCFLPQSEYFIAVLVKMLLLGWVDEFDVAVGEEFGGEVSVLVVGVGLGGGQQGIGGEVFWQFGFED